MEAYTDFRNETQKYFQSVFSVYLYIFRVKNLLRN